MEGFLIRGWDLVLPGWWGFHTVRGGIDPRDHRLLPRCVGVADVWNDFSFGGWTLSSPGGVGFTNSSRSAISQWGWSSHTLRGRIDPGDHRIRPPSVGVLDAWKDLSSGDGILPSPGGACSTNPSQSTISELGWGFYIVRGGIDPGDYRFRPRFIGVADTWKDFSSGDGTLSFSIFPGGRWLMLAVWLE